MKLYEKARKMKKAFCFDICPFLSQEKCVHVWFEFFPNYLSRKKEPRKHFSASALPRPRKIFPWFLFPTSAKIGKNSNQTWTNFSRDKTGQISKQNTIFLYKPIKYTWRQLACSQMYQIEYIIDILGLQGYLNQGCTGCMCTPDF